MRRGSRCFSMRPTRDLRFIKCGGSRRELVLQIDGSMVPSSTFLKMTSSDIEFFLHRRRKKIQWENSEPAASLSFMRGGCTTARYGVGTEHATESRTVSRGCESK